MNRMDSEQQLEDYMAYAKRFHIADILYFNPTGEMKILEV